MKRQMKLFGIAHLLGIYFFCFSCSFGAAGTPDSQSSQQSYQHLKEHFLDLPLEEKQTGPLYWIQEEGNTAEKDIAYVNIMIEGGNGHCTIESRIYEKWLQPSWFDIVDLILNEMKKKGAKAYIFDEAWFPSFDVDGQVPKEHRTKLLQCSAVELSGPEHYTDSGHEGKRYIKTIAGKVKDDTIDASSFVDLTPYIDHGDVQWNVPEGTWKVMKFTWEYNTRWGKTHLLDLASQDAADWFVETVVKPHYEKTSAPDAIAGFFYDEPEFYGQWGKGMEEDTPHWKEMLVHRFFTLSGEAHKKAQYTYMKTLADRIGRVGYGTYRDYVRSQDGKLIGHFWEHNHPLTWGHGPIDIMEVQKYSDMGGIDYVAPGTAAPVLRSKEKGILHHMARLGASISITNDMDQHLSMNECFAGYELGNYSFIKWSSDLSTLQGSQVLIPHSFNPGNYDEGDWPPYFYRSGTEPSWPLYKIWAERQNRLAYMMQGNDDDNYRIAPVAVIWGGLASHVGNYTLPYNLLSAFESANFDPLLITSSRFESDAVINGEEKAIDLYHSSFKILALPSSEYIPNAVLEKAKKFYDHGGIIIAWGTVPSKSATFEASNEDVQSNIRYLFGDLTPSESTKPIKTNEAGGKTYYVSSENQLDHLTSHVKKSLENCGVHSTFHVLSGIEEDEEWLLYQHRKRGGMDVFMVWNGNEEERNITVRLTASGTPELWHPTSTLITKAIYERVASNQVDVTFHLNPEESVLVVFRPTSSSTSVTQTNVDEVLDIQGSGEKSVVDVCVSENKDYTIQLHDGSHYYQKSFNVSGIPSQLPITDGKVDISSDYLNDEYKLYVDVGSAESARVSVNQDYVPLQGNEGLAGGVIFSTKRVDISSKVKAGENRIQIQPQDPGDASVRVYKKMKVSGFTKITK